MIHDPRTDELRPSWTGPILLTSLATVLVHLFVGVLGAQLGSISFCVCCGLLIPIGFLPIAMVAPRDPQFTPRDGFVLGFLAVGAGATLFAAWHVYQWHGVDVGNLEREIREGLRQVQDPLPPDQRWSAEELDQIVGALLGMAPYFGVLIAVVETVVAAFVGMVATVLIRRRR